MDLRPISTPLGERNLGDEAAVPVPRRSLAADLDPGYERLEGGQRHRATHYRLARHQKVQFGGVDAVQPDRLWLPATMVPPSMTVEEEALRLPDV